MREIISSWRERKEKDPAKDQERARNLFEEIRMNLNEVCMNRSGSNLELKDKIMNAIRYGRFTEPLDIVAQWSNIIEANCGPEDEDLKKELLERLQSYEIRFQ